ncbi:MAG: Glu-tRNA(Gln) amidotransferase subunit GatD [Thermoplasmata archaeon]
MDHIVMDYRGIKISGILVNESNGIITVKLDNGYNMSFDKSSVEIIERKTIESAKNHEITSFETGNGDHEVTILATGGTIASRIDYRTGAVSPVFDPSKIFKSKPKIQEDMTIRIRSVLNEMSENMSPDDWIKIAGAARDEMKSGRGIVIAHGTDTMSYSASAASFMFSRQSSPIIFVGSQRSSDRPSSDAFSNLEAALYFSVSDFGETGIAMHAGLSNSPIALHRAVRSRKMHTSRRDAFQSIESPIAGKFSLGNVELRPGYRKISDELEMSDKLDKKVSIIYSHPSLSDDDIINMAAGKDAVILMGTGLGHVSSNLIGTIRRMIKDGTYFVMTSQCIYGTVNMNVYSTGRLLTQAGVISAGSMLPEVAYVKAMYVLANYDHEDFKNIMGENLRGEILEREILKEVIL